MADVTIKRFDAADKSVELVKGLLEVIEIGGMALGRAEYEPGWRWSRDVAGDARYVSIHLQGIEEYLEKT